MAENTVTVNRAPVMTLWAAIVNERMGFEPDEAFSLARAVTGLNAQSKGQRLGIYEAPEERGEKARQRKPEEAFSVKVLGRPVPAINTDKGVRGLREDKIINPTSARRYVEKKFGDQLPEVRAAMESLADSYDPDELAKKAYDLYEKFRPDIPSGKKGWGAEGKLDLNYIRSLAKET